MKKIVLLVLSVMAFAGMSMAQDIYIAGMAYNGVGTENAVVYKNGTLLYSQGDDPSFYHDSYDVLYLNDDVYWVDFSWNTNTGEEYGKVYKNGDCFLNNANGSEVYKLFTDGRDVYAAGYQVIGGVELPAIWKNDDPTPFLICDTGGKTGHVEQAVIVDNTIYACGYKSNGTAQEGVVWVNGNVEYVFGELCCADNIAVYNNHIYTLVNERSNDWNSKVYWNGQEYYDLTEDGGGYGMSLDASADLYVLGNDQQIVKVWKNGDVLYSHPEISDYINDIEANSSGVYYLTDHALYKDGVVKITGENLYAFTVSEDCTVDGHTLPYFEGFETGETDWTCWAQWDGDNQNDGEPSYWHRCSYNSASGDYSAWHRYNSTNDQTGVLVTPLLAIPAGGTTTMTFKTYEQFCDDYYYEGLWVIEGGHKVLGDEVWTQNEPSEEWKTVTIDLSAYQGMNIEIDFRYYGLNAHNWYIDDISITHNIGVNENGPSTGSEVLAVYPNPATDRVRIEGLEPGSEVQLFNALGERVMTGKVDANSEIGITELALGLYLMRCGDARIRFVKE